MNLIFRSLIYVSKVFALSALCSLILSFTYFLGYISGYSYCANSVCQFLSDTQNRPIVESTPSPFPSFLPTPTPIPTPKTIVVKPETKANWSGPELWEAVNARRQQLGVNPLNSQSELCTIASIRLNELLDLGKLDGHEGFSSLAERRPDLKWIFEKYNISEFLVSGAKSAQDAVALWENTLGHKKLLTGGEYVWGCVYAQNSFGVAIAAY